MIDALTNLIARGGLIMGPLLLLSVIGVTLVIERAWFWFRTNPFSRAASIGTITRHLRADEAATARALATADHTFYGRLVLKLLDGFAVAKSPAAREAVAIEAIEALRPSLDRFMPTLSTIVTAAPLLGILGTVTGIIDSFGILAQSDTATDPQAVSAGIAEALLSTAAGLIIAIVILFPYNAFRAQADRTLGRAEAIIAAAEAGLSFADDPIAFPSDRTKSV